MVDKPDDEESYDFGDGLDQPAPPIGSEPPPRGGEDDFGEFDADDPIQGGQNVELENDVFDEFGGTADAFDADGESNASKNRIVVMIAGVAALALLGGAGFALYSLLGTSEPPPIIRADTGPIKTPPIEEGGLQVPFQDARVLNPGADDTEVLMRRPPEPILPETTPLPAPSAEEQAQAEPLSPLTPPSVFGGGGEPLAPLTPTPNSDAPLREQGVLSAGRQLPTSARERPRAPADLTRETSRPAGGEAAQTEQPPVRELAPPPQSAAVPPAAAPPEPLKPKPAAPKPTADAKGWKVQLASLRSRAAAERGWANFRNKAPDLLREQPLTIQQARVSGATYFRIQAGDFAQKSGASGLCRQLKSRGLDCIVTK